MRLCHFILLAALGAVASQPPQGLGNAVVFGGGTVLSSIFYGFVKRYSSWNSPPESWTHRTVTPEELEAMNSAMRNLSAAQAQGYDAFVANYNFTKKTVELALRGQLPTEQEDCSNPDMPLQAPTTAPGVVPLQAPTTEPTRTPTGGPARRHTRRPFTRVSRRKPPYNWNACRGTELCAERIEAHLLVLGTFDDLEQAKAELLTMVSTIFGPDTWDARRQADIVEIRRLYSNGNIALGPLVDKALEVRGELGAFDPGGVLENIGEALFQAGLVAIKDGVLVDGPRLVRARDALVERGYSPDSRAVGSLTVETTLVVWFNLVLSDLELQKAVPRLIYAHCFWGAYSMVAVKKFPGLLDDFWKAGAGDSLTLVASGDKSAYKRMVKACADAYPYAIVRGMEQPLLDDLHKEKKMQKELYDAIKESDEQWTLIAVTKDVVVRNGAEPRSHAIYYVELPADEMFSTSGLGKIDNVPALTTPFAYLTVAVAQAGRAQAGGYTQLAADLKQFGPNSKPANYRITTHRLHTSNLIGSVQVELVAISASGDIKWAHREGPTGFHPLYTAYGQLRGPEVRRLILRTPGATLASPESLSSVREYYAAASAYSGGLAGQVLAEEEERATRALEMQALTLGGIENGGGLAGYSIVAEGHWRVNIDGHDQYFAGAGPFAGREGLYGDPTQILLRMRQHRKLDYGVRGPSRDPVCLKKLEDDYKRLNAEALDELERLFRSHGAEFYDLGSARGEELLSDVLLVRADEDLGEKRFLMVLADFYGRPGTVSQLSGGRLRQFSYANRCVSESFVPALVAAEMNLEAVDLDRHLVFHRTNREIRTAAKMKVSDPNNKPFFEVGKWRREPDQDVPSPYAAGEICERASEPVPVFVRPDWAPYDFTEIDEIRDSARRRAALVRVFNEKFAPQKAPYRPPRGYNDKEHYLRACLEAGRIL